MSIGVKSDKRKTVFIGHRYPTYLMEDMLSHRDDNVEVLVFFPSFSIHFHQSPLE